MCGCISCVRACGAQCGEVGGSSGSSGEWKLEERMQGYASGVYCGDACRGEDDMPFLRVPAYMAQECRFARAGLACENTDCRVWLISCHADWNSGLSRSISWMVLSSIFSVGVCALSDWYFQGGVFRDVAEEKNMCGRQYLLRSNSVKCRLTP